MNDPRPKTFKQWVKTTHWDFWIIAVIGLILLFVIGGGVLTEMIKSINTNLY